jgi:hypothetical protein
MICSGDLVQDWMGRPGIAIEKTDPPAPDELCPGFGRRLCELEEETTWWSIALFEGSVCKSPQLLTDSRGRAGNRVLKMAGKLCRPSVKNRLDVLLALRESGKRIECGTAP